MADQRFDVAIVGCGVPGLAAALGFAQQSLSVALIGPRPRPHVPSESAPFDPRIYALAPGSAALLDRLGVWGRIDSTRIAPVERMRVFGDTGDELTFDAYAAAVERLATIVEEGELLRVLDAACDYQPSIKRLEDRFRSADVRGPEVEVVCDGTTVHAALTVGADGAGSAVRAAAAISADTKAYAQTAFVANFSCERPHLETAWQWFTGEGVVALLPLPGMRVSLVWSAPDRLVPELLALDAAAFAARLTERTAGALGRVSMLGAIQTFPLRLITVEKMIGARLALVGDAAHVVHPLAGQGLNLGLQDVDALLEAVATREPFRSPGDPRVLRRYQRARAEAVGLMRLTTDGLARLFAVDDAWVRRGRNAGMSVLNRIKPLKSRLIRQALG